MFENKDKKIIITETSIKTEFLSDKNSNNNKKLDKIQDKPEKKSKWL